MRTLTLVGLMLAAQHGFAAAGAAPIPEVQAYSSALDGFLQGKQRRSVEPVFSQARKAGRKLVSVLESMEEAAFESLRKDLKGFVLARGETVAAEPDLEFFRDLAERKGLDADRAFFALALKTKPDGLWPAYIEQQTDYSGCTKYGDGAMARLYGDWTAFRKKFPSGYAGEAEGELGRIASELTEGTCACGGEESVLAELEAFIKAFPKSPLAGKLKGRGRLIRDGKDDMRFECQSG